MRATGADYKKGNSMRLHGTERWRRMAKHQLRVEPLCRMCLAEGKVAAATTADHIEPHGGDINKFWLGKLQEPMHQLPFRSQAASREVGL